MKVYFASYSTTPTVPMQCLLESFLYFRKKDYKDWHISKNLLGKDLFLDSGAFSAFSAGKKIDLDEYIEYIKKYSTDITVYAGLDVIGDWKKTRDNIEYMEDKGLHPLPTFHFNSPLDELRRMCKKYDYIALGGLVPLSMKKDLMRKWLDICFSIIIKEGKLKGSMIKIHGFGVNSFWVWKRYPFYSVDATSWLTGGVFRRIIEFKRGGIVTHAKSNPKKTLLWLKTSKAHYHDLNIHNAIEYKKAADFVTDLWEKRGVVWTN